MFLDSYTDVASQVTDAPTVFHEFMAYFAAAAVVGNNVHLVQGADQIRTNLWGILVAPSSACRKSTSLNLCKRIIREVRPEVIYPNEFSSEKLLEIMEGQPTGIFFYSEFASFMGAMNRDYLSGFKSTLTDLYDYHWDYKKSIKTKSFVIQHPCISFASATTVHWMMENMQESDVEGGFLPRFMIIPATEKPINRPFREPMNMELWSRALWDLEKIKDIRGEMTLSPQAKGLYEEWFYSFEKKYCQQEKCASFIRMETHVLKLAMLFQLCLDQSLVVSELAIASVLEEINWLAKQYVVFETDELVFGKFAKVKKRITKLIKSRGLEGISRAELSRYSHESGKDLDGVLTALFQEESIIKLEFPSANGRFKTAYLMKEHANHATQAELILSQK